MISTLKIRNGKIIRGMCSEAMAFVVTDRVPLRLIFEFDLHLFLNKFVIAKKVGTM